MRHSGISDTADGRDRPITDFDEACRVFEIAYAPNRIIPVGRSPQIELRVSTLPLPLLDVGAVQIDGALSMDAPAPRDCFVILGPRRGGVTISSGRDGQRASPGRLAVLPPGLPLHYEDWARDSEFTTLRVQESVITAHEQVVVGGAVPRRAGPMLVDLLAAPARPLAWMMGLLSREAWHPSGTLANRPLGEQVSALALTGLLLAMAEPAALPASPSRQRVLRCALDTAEADNRPLLSPADLARAAAVSVRTLQVVFRAELQTTPAAYLRRRRLARAHAELARSDYDATTAEAVAQRWGFTNYGRFTRAYRSVYGVSPASTLRDR